MIRKISGVYVADVPDKATEALLKSCGFRRKGTHLATADPCAITRSSKIIEMCHPDLKAEMYEARKHMVSMLELSSKNERMEIDGLRMAEGIELMPFQTCGVTYMLRAGRCLNGDSMGLGKTLQGAACIKYLFDSGLASTALVICPASLKINWQQELLSKTGLESTVIHSKWKPNRCRLAVINYDIIGKFSDFIHAMTWDVLVCDECMPYDAMVHTDCGLIKIGDIVTKKLAVSVLSLDTSSNELSYKPVTRWYENRMNANMVAKITHAYGTLYCTSNHKIWVEGVGYVRADEIQSGDNLRILREEVLEKKKRESNREVLLNVVCRKAQRISTRSKAKASRRIVHSEHRGAVRVMRKHIFCKTKEGWQCCWEILRKILLGKMENVATGVRKCHHKSKYRKEASIQIEAGLIGKNEETEHRSCIQGKAETNIHRVAQKQPVVYKEGREAICYGSSTKTAQCASERLCDGAHTVNKRCQTFGEEPSYALLDRHCKQRENDRNRGGRANSQYSEMEMDRREKRKDTVLSRVDRVEIQKQGSDDRFGFCVGEDTRTYDIEVANNHNYFSDGVLVSNCHYIKSMAAGRTKNVLAINSKYFFALSGTPMPNNPSELFPVLHKCRPDMFPDQWQFYREYCYIIKEHGHMKIVGGKNLDRLRNKLRATCMVRRKKEDVLKDLPPKRRQIIEVENSFSKEVDAELTAYNDLENLRKELADLKSKCDETHDTDSHREMMEAVAAKSNECAVAYGKLSSARKELAVVKIPVCLEHIMSVLEEVDKVVVFAYHKEPVYTMVGSLNAAGYKTVCMTGETPSEDRQKAKDEFQDGDARVIIGTFGAMGVGWTLTASSHMIMTELDWVPANLDQSEDRCNRIGQKFSVLVQYLILHGSLDGMMIKKLVVKGRLIDKVMN